MPTYPLDGKAVDETNKYKADFCCTLMMKPNDDRYTTTNHGSFNKSNESYNHSNNDYYITDNSQRTSDDAELQCQVADIHARLPLQTMPPILP